jgi:pimeloyl-ACP methyl ester carboxylesterase
MQHKREPGKYIEVEPGVELYYEDYGQGTPLLFVPGWTFTGEVFEHQVAHFAATHRVIVVDPRGQGRSSVTLHGNDYATHGADLAKLIKALELRDVVLVGWSFGLSGRLGLCAAGGPRRAQGDGGHRPFAQAALHQPRRLGGRPAGRDCRRVQRLSPVSPGVSATLSPSTPTR